MQYGSLYHGNNMIWRHGNNGVSAKSVFNQRESEMAAKWREASAKQSKGEKREIMASMAPLRREINRNVRSNYIGSMAVSRSARAARGDASRRGAAWRQQHNISENASMALWRRTSLLKLPGALK
jgi:hypothetical protein